MPVRIHPEESIAISAGQEHRHHAAGIRCQRKVNIMNTNVTIQKYSYTELGMIFGMLIGSGIGVTAFASTNNVLFFTVPGFGLILGLGIGSSLDKRRRQ